VSAHRTSAIALYRALLQQTRAVPLPSQSQQELQNIVRNRCKQAIHLHSYQRLKLAFQAGYEAIDHLDAAIAGNEESTRFIAGLLARAPAGVKADPPVGLLLKNKTRGSKSEGTIASTSLAQALRPKPSTELLSRPLPLAQLSGKRHVPVLFNANHIPILRIKKPQPENLSGFIKHRIKQRQRRHDRRHWLVEQIEFAQYEDLWDDIVARETGVGEQDEPTWAEEFVISKAEVDKAIWEEGRKNAEMAARMQGVVDREREAFEEERRKRREARRVERAERRNAKDDEREEAG
jgi:hypothetical protein